MTLQHLRKYAWFVFLMTLVIGWSGVSIAQTPMQHDLPTMPCHSEKISHTNMHSHASDQAICHESMDQVSHSHGEHCQDCNPVHCQIVNLALQQALPDLESQFIPISSQFSSIYQAQHLAGYWQEILRPPKA
ncbi:hypothetical protein KTI78_10210 [Acinetobacter sp. WU_MDCI_Abxe161]|uniref:hypothetical protein n=1 Tax=Acinetobacter sp. WU_MDCI_Abxe161 TaxID=2850074 RepID=UPI0021CDDA34|nr:hypothetical protein [Acinetobacter sp. WU_MDCI_Abxe161]MCU4503536.1 hypothetical protein [Acinetobacter sp. WU_MDCI_Abxe161]